MNPLRTTVVMKTDITGSTARFRQLLAADLQALLSEHRDFLARHAAEHDGRIMKGAGDGYWLEFPSVTGAAKAAIAMQESLRLAQLSRGDDRLAIRIVIALGDIAVQDGDFNGDAFALAARVEAVTPPDEIYLTAGGSACHHIGRNPDGARREFRVQGLCRTNANLPYRAAPSHACNRRHLHPVLRPRRFR